MIEAELPDGTVLEFPDGTSPDVVKRAVKARLGAGPAPAPTATPAKAPEAFQRAGEGAYAGSPLAGGPLDLIPAAANSGIADAAIRGVAGVKDLYGMINPVYGAQRRASGGKAEDDAVIKEQEAEFKADPEKGRRILGNVAGNVLTSAIPMAPVARGAQAITSNLPRALQAIGAGAATSGAQGFIMNPGDAEQKLKSAGMDAAAGGALAGAGTVLKKALTQPFAVKPEAEKLFQQGVNPTLQQGAESKLGQFIGGLTSGSAGVRKRQETELENALMDRITGGRGWGISPTRKENVALADDVISRDYDAILRGKKFPISPTTRADVAGAAMPMTKTNQFLNETREAQGILANIMGDYPRNINVSSEVLQQKYLRPLSDAISDSKSNIVKAALLDARDTLIARARDSRLSADELDALKKVDIRNYDFSRLREAARGAGGEKEGITLAKLESAYSNARPMAGNNTADELIGPATRTMGETLKRDSAQIVYNLRRALGALIGSTFAGPVAQVPLGTAYGLSLAGQTKGGSKLLLGQMDSQKKLAEVLKNASPYALGSGHSFTGEN